MITLPQWVQRIFAESVCPHCEKEQIKTKLKHDGVYSVGMREEISKKTKKVRLSFFYEYRCDVCGKPSRFSGFPTNIHDFINDMIEISNSPLQDAITDHEHKKMKDKKSKPTTEGISNLEVESFKKLMEETQSFEDLLDKIGITQEERLRLKEAYKDDN